MESQGRDIKLDEKRVEGYRNFATKLWNAARFLQMNGVGASDSIAAPAAELPVNRWIIGKVVQTLEKVNRAFDELRYDEMANAIYHFVWGTFCDWYIELIKPLPQPEETARLLSEGVVDERWDETRTVAAWAFDQILVMLHPLMPFITEQLWNAMAQRSEERPYDLIVAKWPEPAAVIDPQAGADIDWLIQFIKETRSARAELNVPPGADVNAWVMGANGETYDRMERNLGYLVRKARIKDFANATGPVRNALQVIVDEATFFLEVANFVDIETEKSRLDKAAAAAEKERDSLKSRLENPNFTGRAKPEAVEKARSDHEAKAAEAERLRAALERLG
jgi:valyl-tRNA synthetase